MNEGDVRTLILGILKGIAPEADLAELPGDDDLREALDIDSMDFLRLVTEVHRSTRVDIPERDYSKVRTLDALVSYLLPSLVDAAPS